MIDSPVDADSYLLELLRYIHRNPLESGVVDDINKYTWSSHKAYLSGAKEVAVIETAENGWADSSHFPGLKNP